jgi:hypothetical protein
VILLDTSLDTPTDVANPEPQAGVRWSTWPFVAKGQRGLEVDPDVLFAEVYAHAW